MAELYRWSSAEFRDEYALIYTSRSNPSLTCFSHYKVNRDKVLFALSDCLCEGNTVRVDMKFMGDRDYMGRFVLRSADAEDSSGSFMEKIARPGLFLLTYYDKFYHRIGMPTDDVVKENKQGTTHVMENKQGNDDVGDTDHGSTQRTAILNAGRTQGNFNGSNFRDCKIVVDAQAIQFKDFNNST
ncbi:hypothetical protein K1719_024223 [Acacia pycnantha]|nr:hypothetical protein K1719_024223 [Acacia pycnantha]